MWKLSICRLNGESVYSEVNRNSGFVSDGVDHKICIAADMQPNEHFYGFGEKFNGLNQRGNKIVIELDDAFASTDEKTYKSSFRSLPRPSSAPTAKASTVCS